MAKFRRNTRRKPNL